MRAWAVLLLALAAACGSEPSAKAPAAPAKGAARPAGVHAEVTIVDYDGRPLAGIRPIATRTPNAFGTPVAQGPESDAEGHAAFTLPRGEERLFVRAWDREMKFFPNNFFEIPHLEGDRTAPMEVVMVPAAGLEARLVDGAGRPVSNAPAELMLIHPQQGPWWPAEARTDIAGQVRFGPVPPGDYLIELKVPGTGKANLPLKFIPPTQSASVGDVTLK